MNEEITASMTYDAKSMTPALRWHNHRQNRFGLIAISLPLVMGVLSFFLAHAGPLPNGLVITPAIPLVAACTVLFFLLVRFLGPFLFARGIRSSPSHGKPITYRISEGGVKVTVANGKAEYSWGHFLRSLIAPDGVLLYTQKLAFNWLPKTAFPTESDYNRFLGLVTAKTKHSQIG